MLPTFAGARGPQRNSRRSLQSGPSVTTIDTKLSSLGKFEPYEVYYLEKESALTMKHPISNLTQEDCFKFSEEDYQPDGPISSQKA
ncbi:hypothetical protein KIN20_014425 [Parelaphostrongylus tenuis]|uniref:Uncharacterized protein n=1 Tax=Parelaphostrongylus tenuis TaxID=148309 RepID=A0AAD5MZ89_PARTN|nr:hypothetical protein KIN20_014425 [Parelaphostrongylus tenuis]